MVKEPMTQEEKEQQIEAAWRQHRSTEQEGVANVDFDEAWGKAQSQRRSKPQKQRTG